MAQPTYRIEHENLPQIFINIDSQLNSIEVKGESVKYLFNVRNYIKELFDTIQKIENVENNVQPNEKVAGGENTEVNE